METVPPEIIFIVPYRDREPHKHFFSEYMNRVVMSDHVKNKDYAIYFVEQKDTRPFNRGAMKNIGFLAIKYKYPLHYRDITFVFNDVDTIPHKKNVLNYKTNHGTIKHFYGFTFALGGIFSITGADFERIEGFPNFWGWGCEDNCIYDRAIQNGIYVDRSTFFKIGDMNILHIYDGVVRNICRKEAYSAKMKSTTETVFTIRNLSFEYTTPNKTEDNNGDNNGNNNSNGDSGVDVFYFDTQTNSNDVRIESQNIITEKTINLNPVIKERFSIQTNNPARPVQVHSYSSQQPQLQQQQQQQLQPQHRHIRSNRVVNMMMKPFMR